MVERLIVISNLLLAGAAIFVLLSVFLWFRFHIWKIIGDLSGKNERRSLEQKRAGIQNGNSEKKRFVYGSYRTRRIGKTGSMKKTTEKLVSKTMALKGNEEKTQLLIDNTENQTEVLGGNTMVLSNNQDTMVLAQTEKLNQKFTVIETILFVHTEEEIG